LPLEARPAGDRPIGVAEHSAGHGSEVAAPFPLSDRPADVVAPLSAAGRAFHDRFVDAVDDDLDLPRALAAIREVVRSSLSDDEKRWLALDADLVLGLDLHRVWDDDLVGNVEAMTSEVTGLVAARTAARATREYPAADAARDRLVALGYDVIDTPTVTTVRRRD
jgi:cysteinyl-tRNA synthetase